MDVLSTMADNWVYWAVSIFAIIAAYIDGKELRVPNKITLPMIVAGWIWSSIHYGNTGQGWYIGLMWSLAGTCLLYTSPSPRDQRGSRMPSSA